MAVKIMEDTEWQNMFVVGPDPKRLVFMRPEYRESAKNGLKHYFPQLFPTIEIEVNKDYGIIFKSDKTRLYFTKYYTDHNAIDLEFDHWIPERNKWMNEYEILQETGDEDTYIGDPNEELVLYFLKNLYETTKPWKILNLKRSEIGWSDPITMAPIRSSEAIIRLNKDNRFIFQKRALETAWITKLEKTNPLTNQPVTSQQIEKFITNITEDAGDEPVGGRRKRRKTLRRKNLRSSRKR
jgi:hypothetical protein